MAAHALDIASDEYKGFLSESIWFKFKRLTHTFMFVSSVLSLATDASRPEKLAADIIGIITSLINLYLHRINRLETDVEVYTSQNRKYFCILFPLTLTGLILLMILVINGKIGWPIGFLSFLSFVFSIVVLISSNVLLCFRKCCCKKSLEDELKLKSFDGNSSV